MINLRSVGKPVIVLILAATAAATTTRFASYIFVHLINGVITSTLFVSATNGDNV